MEECGEFPHPFVHRVELSRQQRVKGIILGIFLFPARIFLATLFFLLMWPVARLRLAGLSAEERSRPVTGWRRWLLHPLVWALSRAVFLSVGFPWLRVKGRRAGLREAPMLVVAPHSSFLDMLVLCPTQLATVVSRSENSSLPVIGALLEFNQSVLVSRNDPESRKEAVAQLNRRLTSNGYWPQMLVFPEGTTTNGRALIKFKRGAFLAGVPVQPVLLRYPNQLDTVRWTHKGTSWMETLWHTTTQLYTNATVEFLPVYRPSDEERKDANLYADNVQRLMARALGIPATSYVLEGGVPVSKLGGLSVPLEPPARDTLSLLRKNGLGDGEIQALLDRMTDKCRSGAWGSRVDRTELASILAVTKRTATQICGFYSRDGIVDLRQVYFSVSALAGFVDFEALLHAAFTMFDRDEKGSLSEQELSDLMGALLGITQYNAAELYAAASSGGRLTEEDLLRALTTHPTYQRVTDQHLRPAEAGSPLSLGPLTNGTAESNDAQNNNGSLHRDKKSD